MEQDDTIMIMEQLEEKFDLLEKEVEELEEARDQSEDWTAWLAFDRKLTKAREELRSVEEALESAHTKLNDSA